MSLRSVLSLTAAILVVIAAGTPPGIAGTGSGLTTIYAFKSLNDAPNSVVLHDGALYGTTPSDGPYGAGRVVELKPPTRAGGTWTETILYTFTGGADGGNPKTSVVFDASGDLYSTACGGGLNNNGVVFRLAPPSGAGQGWTQTVLYTFQGQADGSRPDTNLVIDAAGAVYGTTQGTFFQLIPPASGTGPWTLNTLPLGSPGSNLVIDSQGNLYGTADSGGASFIFELTRSGGEWTETTLYTSSSGTPDSLTLGLGGVLYGVDYGGSDVSGCNCDTIFQLSPPAQPGGDWTYSTL